MLPMRSCTLTNIMTHCARRLLMEPTEPTPAPRELDILLSTAINVLSTLVPDWQPPVLAHPHAVPYNKTLLRLRDNIVPGDQVMAMAPSGYSHHGIYVGMQSVGGEVVSASGARATRTAPPSVCAASMTLPSALLGSPRPSTLRALLCRTSCQPASPLPGLTPGS